MERLEVTPEAVIHLLGGTFRPYSMYRGVGQGIFPTKVAAQVFRDWLAYKHFSLERPDEELNHFEPAVLKGKRGLTRWLRKISTSADNPPEGWWVSYLVRSR